MENTRLKVSFLEREFFAESRDGKSIRGHEPAIIESEVGIRLGRIIEPEEISRAQFSDTLLFQTFLSLETANYNLPELVGNNASGKKWLEQFREHCERYQGERIPETLEIRMMNMPYLEYGWVSEDYIKTHVAGEGIIDSLPVQMAYVKISPPLKLANGDWIRRAFSYTRKVAFSDGLRGSFHTHDPREPQHFNSEGVLIGELNYEDLKNPSREFGKFPATHAVEISYTAAISDISSVRPLTILFELKKQEV